MTKEETKELSEILNHLFPIDVNKTQMTFNAHIYKQLFRITDDKKVSKWLAQNVLSYLNQLTLLEIEFIKDKQNFYQYFWSLGKVDAFAQFLEINSHLELTMQDVSIRETGIKLLDNKVYTKQKLAPKNEQ